MRDNVVGMADVHSVPAMGHSRSDSALVELMYQRCILSYECFLGGKGETGGLLSL
jgi:hypothetical protein